MQIDWDEDKSEANLKKHGVAFEEAKTAVYDPFSKSFSDSDHEVGEDCWLTLGNSERGRVDFPQKSGHGVKTMFDVWTSPKKVDMELRQCLMFALELSRAEIAEG